MLGVIYLHTAAGTLQQLENRALWNFSNVFTCLFTLAVPLFFMMSGSLLLEQEKTADLGQLFRHRLPKVAVPACVWTALILLFRCFTGSGEEAKAAFLRLLNNPVMIPYWFLYALGAMYLLSPMLKKMTDNLSDAHWNYMMALWVFLTLGLSTLRQFVPEAWQLTVTEHWTLNINVVGGYLGYFLLGAYLERLQRTFSKGALASVSVILALVSILGTIWNSYHIGAYTDHFTNYLTLLTMVRSAALFLLAKACLREKEPKGRLVPCLAGLSFGVYLIHPLAIGLGETLWIQFINYVAPVTIPQQVIFYLCVSLFCILTCLILASIPVVCYLFTGQTYRQACSLSNLQALFCGKQRKLIDKASKCDTICCVQGNDGAQPFPPPQARGDSESPRRSG